MREVAIVDYGLCNLDSVARAVEECGGVPRVTGDPSEIPGASHIILPGVGAFADGMAELRRRDLEGPLLEVVRERKVPFLGICLGMQLMATRGYEGRETPGLGLIDAEVHRLEPDAPSTRIPHIGWNEVHPSRVSPLFEGIPDRKDFYFVHSYHVVCRNAENALAFTPYCGGFVSAICSGTNIFGVQFHPEKSQRPGFQLLRNFISL